MDLWGTGRRFICAVDFEVVRVPAGQRWEQRRAERADSPIAPSIGARTPAARRFDALAVALLVFAAVLSWSTSLARAQSCSSVTEQARGAEVTDRSALAGPLPDCRAYEQVSPTDKNFTDVAGTAGLVQASPLGTGLTFFAEAPLPQTAGPGSRPTYISTRSPAEDEWTLGSPETLVPPANTQEVIGITEDLGVSIIRVGAKQEGLPCKPTLEVCGFANGLVNVYVHNQKTGSYQYLGTVDHNIDEHSLALAGATPGDAHILLETDESLNPEAPTAATSLYEWNEGAAPSERLRLVGLVPSVGQVVCGPAGPACQAPIAGSFAGPGGPAVERQHPAGTKSAFYTQNAISSDGRRIFFSEGMTEKEELRSSALGSESKGFIYMREPDAQRTIQLSAGNQAAFWRAATRDGRYVFYSEGPELYRFNVDRFEASTKPATEALKEAREQITEHAEGILGTLGIAEESGSYAYFAAPGVLASNLNAEGVGAAAGAANVYEWHEGEITFITQLPSGEEADWRGWTNVGSEAGGPSGGAKSARVTPDGTALLFSSTARYAGYDNKGFNELYLYSADRPLSTTNPICVSCNPRGLPPTVTPFTQTRLTDHNPELIGQPESRNALLTHNLADSGRRVFFETGEALIPGDANEQRDVYEWEADGEGSCESETQNGGCLFLISTGQGAGEAYFGDASASGADVFFFTRQPLVGQDQDVNMDVYDARVDGGILAQSQPPPVAPCTEETTCRSGAPMSTPSLGGAPASSQFSGSGNLPPVAPAASGTGGKHETLAQARARKLAAALKTCRTKRGRARKRCETVAHRRYGRVSTLSGKGHR